MDSIAKLLRWLYQPATSNDPLLVDKLYLNCIKQYKVVHKLLKMDPLRMDSVNYYYCRFYSSKEIGFQKL